MTPVPISLGEGNTPLVPSRWIGPHLGLSSVHFKLEQTNPTGSYKDRFAARLITLLVQGGHPFCLATSSGNSGAAVAAYSAAARSGQVFPHERIVCLVTGHGYKDDAAAQRIAKLDSANAAGDEPVTVDQIDDSLLERLTARP